MYEQDKQTGVSPVIGVILMVAVTVALVALVTVVVFDIGGEISESPDAAVELQSDLGDQEVTATVLRNENVEEFKVFDPESSNPDGLKIGGGSNSASAGDSVTLTASGTQHVQTGSPGTVIVVATMPDGSQEVLTTTDYDFS